MNLIQQFPDISEERRSKNESGYRNSRTANARQVGYMEEAAVVQYYPGEFRRWHIKFILMVAATLGTIYVALLKSSWIYNLIDAG